MPRVSRSAAMGVCTLVAPSVVRQFMAAMDKSCGQASSQRGHILSRVKPLEPVWWLCAKVPSVGIEIVLLQAMRTVLSFVLVFCCCCCCVAAGSGLSRRLRASQLLRAISTPVHQLRAVANPAFVEKLQMM